ncbi:MAG: class I SAM-dependent methyltransferase [Deltaproteobacteria bacterium]|nr:class I SAM-dependent methyltransferase [Deltaproteobacteria bacterium]
MKKLRDTLGSLLPCKIVRLKKGVVYENRYDYQKNHVKFAFNPGAKILDLGSGNHPAPFATHLVDLFVEDNFHRGGVEIVKDNRPLIVADLEKLPFKDKEFDFVYCSHVLEHVSDPKLACQEIIRIGKRGYIETPTRLSDMLYNFSYLHKWHVNLVGNTLIFMEYSEREKQGTGSSYFFEEQTNPFDNETKNLVYKNREIFCNMFMWENDFEYYAFDKNGKPL